MESSPQEMIGERWRQMQHYQPQGTFPLRAYPHCRPQAADRCALADLVSSTRSELESAQRHFFLNSMLPPIPRDIMTSP